MRYRFPIRWATAVVAAIGLRVATSNAAAPAADGLGETLRVVTASELLAAIAPHRTIELAAGDYDLGAVASSALPHVSWDEKDYLTTLVVHDVDGLTIRGPTTGTARLFSDRRTALLFRDVRGLTLRGLAIGRPLRPPLHPDDEKRLAGPHVVQGKDVVFEDLRLLGDGCSPIELEDVENARITGLDDLGCSGLEVRRGTHIRLEDATIRRFGSEGVVRLAEGTRDVVLSKVTFLHDAPPDRRVRDVVSAAPGASGVLEAVRVVDWVTGKVRHAVGRTVLPLAPARTAPSFVLVRTAAPAKATRGQDVALPEGATDIDRFFSVRVRLEDGRAVALGKEGWRSGLSPGSVQLRALGGPSDPLLITWSDEPQGSGNYTSDFYRVVAPTSGEVVLAGLISAQGHGGWSNGYYGNTAFDFDRGFLTMSESWTTWDRSEKPGPGFELEHEGSQPLYERERACASEVIYRWEGGKLAPFRYEEYRRVESADDVAALLAEIWRPVWPKKDGSLPVRGEWLRHVTPIDEGAKAHPMLDFSEGD